MTSKFFLHILLLKLQKPSMVLTLYGNLELDALVQSEIGNFICLSHFFRFAAVTILKFIFIKYILSFTRGQRFLCHDTKISYVESPAFASHQKPRLSGSSKLQLTNTRSPTYKRCHKYRVIKINQLTQFSRIFFQCYGSFWFFSRNFSSF